MSGAHAFARISDRRFLATHWAAGPWSASFCHGGAPAALLAHVAERVPAVVPMAVARITVEQMRPVPVAELEVGHDVLRDGRKLQLVGMTLTASGIEVARATVVRMRREALPPAGMVTPATMSCAGPEHGSLTMSPQVGGFSGLFEMRSVRGGFEHLGPAAVWFRMAGRLVDGEPTTPLVRAVASADFANGIAGVLPFADWAYPSTDLTVGFVREPQGEWTMVDAATWAGGEGRALCHASLGDEAGWTGHALQTSIVEERRA